MSNQLSTKTFGNQHLLPRLPIPDLDDTATRYLASLKPLLSDDEYARSKFSLSLFVAPGGLGQTLQRRLIAYDKKQKNSWLEQFWLEYAYLRNRDSLIVNQNWFAAAKEHENTPPRTIYGELGRRLQGTFSDYQLQRAASYISTLLDIKSKIEKEEVNPEVQRSGAICMDQFRKVFGMSRLPRHVCDVLSGNYKALSTYIIVLTKNQIYQVEVYDAQSSTRIKVADIQSQLKKVVKDVLAQKDMQPAIGIFTASDRDHWATVYKYLCDISSVNRDSLWTIQHALFAVCLDDYSLPYTVDDLARYSFHGIDGNNRWFDKNLNVSFMNDGRAGFNGEHSACDAYVPGIISATAISQEPEKDPEGVKQNSVLSDPKRLTWEIDANIVHAMQVAQNHAKEVVDNSSLNTIQFKGYGGNFIKTHGKCSPDSFVQLAIQLTYHRLHEDQGPVAVYESASTRQFLHGRTETCRSLTSHSHAFVTGFRSSPNHKVRYNLFKKAADEHNRILKEAVSGKGIDRHLFVLQMMMTPQERITLAAEFFKDTGYVKSKTFTLCTAPIFPGLHVAATGFGAIVPDGYGISYMIEPEQIKVQVECKKACASTSSEAFVKVLKQTLKEMRLMCLDGGPKNGHVSKL